MSHIVAEKSDQVIQREYGAFLKEIKEKILSSQVKAALAVNRELIALYWEIGSKIHLKQKSEGWGSKTIENLSKDLKAIFPEMKGFSLTNIKYMVQFAKEYPEFAISQQVVGQIPWGHNNLKIPFVQEKRPNERWVLNGGGENRTLVLQQLCIKDYMLIVFRFAVTSDGRRPTGKQPAPLNLESFPQKAERKDPHQEK